MCTREEAVKPPHLRIRIRIRIRFRLLPLTVFQTYG